MEPRNVLIAVSVGEDPRSSMRDSIHSNLSLFNNNLRLLSYLQALLNDCQGIGRGIVAPALLSKSVIDSTMQVIHVLPISSRHLPRHTRTIPNLKTRKKNGQ
jgi:hypothetical protein